MWIYLSRVLAQHLLEIQCLYTFWSQDLPRKLNRVDDIIWGLGLSQNCKINVSPTFMNFWTTIWNNSRCVLRSMFNKLFELLNFALVDRQLNSGGWEDIIGQLFVTNGTSRTRYPNNPAGKANFEGYSSELDVGCNGYKCAKKCALFTSNFPKKCIFLQ